MAKRFQIKNSEFYLTPTQIKQIIEAAARPRDRLILSLLAYTGIRRAELCSIHIEDIEWELSRIHIMKGKGNKHRFVFFSEALGRKLKSFVQERQRGPLFPGRNGGYLSLRAVNYIVARAGKLAEVKNPNPRYPNINPHLFRHSIARNWKNQNGSMESLQKILGHESLRTTLDLYGTESIEDTFRNYCLIVEKLVES